MKYSLLAHLKINDGHYLPKSYVSNCWLVTLVVEIRGCYAFGRDFKCTLCVYAYASALAHACKQRLRSPPLEENLLC